jgi:hypothetical protein
MIQISAGLAWPGSAGETKSPIDGNQIDQGAACPQLNEPEFILPLHDATENSAIKVEHLPQVDDAKDKVIDLANPDHGMNLVRTA